MKKAFFWKFLERFGVQGAQFVTQIILARIIEPELYGKISLMMIFVAFANVFIQDGFGIALIQNKEVEEEDYSSVMWFSLLIATVIYVFLFAIAPAIEIFFDVDDFALPFRILILILFPGAINSVQIAKASRELDYKQVFRGNVIGTVISGGVGVYLALKGEGIWSLVVQSLTAILAPCIVMAYTVDWKPRFVLKRKRLKKLISYGWKLLLSSLISTAYSNLQGLVIGKKYDSTIMAFFNKGKQLPDAVIRMINGSIQSVLLPVLARKQNDSVYAKIIMQQTLKLSCFVVFPIMAGLAGTAPNIVRILLGDKWLLCVPYFQIFCFCYAFWPVHTCNLQTINAMGRSDVFLKLEIIKTLYSVIALAIALAFFETPIAIASTGIFTAFISFAVNAHPNKKIIGYSFREQIKDLLPILVISAVMFLVVMLVGYIPMPLWGQLLLQILCGVSIYIGLSIAARLEMFWFCFEQLRGLVAKKKA